MKIGILTSGVLPVPAVQGGAVENLIDFCLEYNEQKRLHDITVYTVNHPKLKNHTALTSEVNHYHIIETNSRAAKIRKNIYHLLHQKDEYYHYTVEYYLHEALKHINRQNYDLILIENRPGYALKLKNRTKARIVIHQENDYLNTDTQNYQEIYDAVSLIINTSDYITQRVRTIQPNDTKCRTVLNGIDVQRFLNAHPAQRQTLPLCDDDFVIVYSGRLTEDKGILPLIKAIKQTQEIPHLKLMIVGASSYGKDKQPTSFIKQLQQESESIKDKVVFTGFIDYEKVPSLLKMADIAVVPSMWEEPFGLTVVEAMAAGLPLITTRSGGIPEICEGVAMIVERENIVSNLASVILDLYQHPEKRKHMSAAAVERSKLFDKERYAREFFKAIENP